MPFFLSNFGLHFPSLFLSHMPKTLSPKITGISEYPKIREWEREAFAFRNLMSWARQPHQHSALWGRLMTHAGIPHIARALCFWGFSRITLHNTASDQTGKTLFHYRRKPYIVTYQPRFTGNQQHFSTWALCNSCLLQKSAVSSHHYNSFVLH